jgi:hypothetical protein
MKPTAPRKGIWGMKMRAALPNAFLFGLTGTPINRRDRNTFYAFGAAEDENGYMSRYGFEESIRDGATLPLHFEPRLIELHIDKEAIDAGVPNFTGGLSDLDKEMLARTAARMAVLVKAPERVENLRRHRPPLPGKGSAQRLQRHGRHLRPGKLPAVQSRAGPASAARRERNRHLRLRQGARRRALQAATSGAATKKKHCSTATATPTTRCKF